MKEYISVEEVEEILEEMGIEVVEDKEDKEDIEEKCKKTFEEEKEEIKNIEDFKNKTKCDSIFKLTFYNNKIERYFNNYEDLIKYLKEILNENISDDSSVNSSVNSSNENLKEFLQEVQDENSEVKNYYSTYYHIEKIDSSKFFERDYAWSGEKCWDGNKHFKEVFTDLDSDTIKELYKKWDEYISEFDEKECCVDSERIGRVDNKKSMEEYYKLKTCCGSDDTLVNVNGIEFMFGCNFGH